MTTSNEENQKEAEYVAGGGNKCPVCGSNDISAERLESDSSQAWADVNCRKCGSTWQDVYSLVGYSNLVKGENA